MDQQRFKGVIGQDYELFQLAMPHHDAVQDAVRMALQEHIKAMGGAYPLDIVEAGTGTGITTARILDADPRLHVITVDSETATQEQARVHLARVADRIRFVRSGITEFLQSLEDESIDVFASAFMIHNLPAEQRAALMAEIARTLRSGGLFVNADKYAHDDEESHQAALEEQVRALAVFAGHGRPDLRTAWERHYREDELIRFTEAEQQKLLEDTFTLVTRIFRQGMEAIFTAVRAKRQ